VAELFIINESVVTGGFNHVCVGFSQDQRIDSHFAYGI